MQETWERWARYILNLTQYVLVNTCIKNRMRLYFIFIDLITNVILLHSFSIFSVTVPLNYEIIIFNSTDLSLKVSFISLNAFKNSLVNNFPYLFKFAVLFLWHDLFHTISCSDTQSSWFNTFQWYMGAEQKPFICVCPFCNRLQLAAHNHDRKTSNDYYRSQKMTLISPTNFPNVMSSL